ncbi:MAG: class I tRNA ligase family protein [Desulfonatronovibrio sp.]
MQLLLQNTLTRKKDRFQPRKENQVKLFTCGPSVYNLPHIGNYRTYVYEDILERTLEALGYQVKRMINFTDIEDKALSQAQSRGLKNLSKLTRPNEEQFFKDAQTLGIRLPDNIPRSSTSVDQAAKLIKILVEKGNAYWHRGDVFFDPLTFKEFGKLYGLDMSRWPSGKVRFRKDTYPGQRWNLGDFILWHGKKKHDAFFWETEIGKGRPAWNIQDPAMISQELGYELDIFCGGVDNLYRHHDYNIAVMESLSQTTLARFWLHGEHLLVDGAKMSKSKGNIVYPQDLFQKGWSPGFLRFFLLSAHYRSKLDLSAAAIESAWSTFNRLRTLVKEFQQGNTRLKTPKPSQAFSPARTLFHGAFVHLADDLDIPSSVNFLITAMEQFQAMKIAGRLSREEQSEVMASLTSLDKVLGFIFEKESEGTKHKHRSHV